LDALKHRTGKLLVVDETSDIDQEVERVRPCKVTVSVLYCNDSESNDVSLNADLDFMQRSHNFSSDHAGFESASLYQARNRASRGHRGT